MRISQMRLLPLRSDGASPLEPHPIDYVFMLLTFVAVVLLAVSLIVFLRQPNKRWSDAWVVLFLVLIPLIGPLVYLSHMRSGRKRD